ncbi:MAG: GDP-L-fucose synthase [Desulfuromonadales bacterium]|nr:GDP-L-fucose synthase [Desulfuromonadales bacterium]
MQTDAKIFVAGSSGLVGSAIIRCLRHQGFHNLLVPDRDRLDLTDARAVKFFFETEQPEYVFLAAAKVGGIHANQTYPAEFVRDNLLIQTHVIHQAWLSGVKRLLFLGSSCIYPKHALQPLREDSLLTGPLEPTNEPYALAKIAGIKMCESYNRQYGTRFVAAMPTNIFGPGDNFHPENSHVVPALIRRFHDAKALQGACGGAVTVWGTGTPRRELLYVDDLAEACLCIMQLQDDALMREFLSYPKPCFVNIGTGLDVTIQELAEMVRQVVGYQGELVFDPSKADGTPRKVLDVSRIQHLGWQAKTDLQKGLAQTYAWYLENAETGRA